MEDKISLSCNSSDVKTYNQSPISFLKGSFNLKNVSFGGRIGKQDALEAVKLDPAVLEAQVTMTVHAPDKDSNPMTPNRSEQVIPEKKKDNDPTPSQCPKGFENMVMQHEAALLSLTPHQLELLMKYADILRRQRMITQRYLECAFCKNNGRPSFWYTSHALRDNRGRVRCPVLRGFRCPRCGATGDQAHTIKYCPDNSLIGRCKYTFLHRHQGPRWRWFCKGKF